MPRLFVAVELPEPVKDQLELMCCGVQGARWMNERQFHVTLAFLGELEGPAAQAVEQGLCRVRGDPFELRLQGVGQFPPRGAAKVLWAGLAPSPELVELHEAVKRALRRSGQVPETRRFAPHVTLARLRGASRSSVARFLEGHLAYASEPFPVRDFQLFRSVLGRSGAQHCVQASYPLFARRD